MRSPKAVRLVARVGLRDVEDVEALAVATVARLGLPLGRVEREDLVAFAIGEVFVLEAAYDETIGCFAGYARRYLPGRVLDEWHRLHRGEHVRCAVGETWQSSPRAFRYASAAVSLDGLLGLPGACQARPVGRFERSELAAA